MGTGHPQGRCAPAGCLTGDCRQWVAPAVGSGIWSDRAGVVAEKQLRSRRGWFAAGVGAKVLCPRWDGAPANQVCPHGPDSHGLTLGPGIGGTGVSLRLGPSKVNTASGWPQWLVPAFGVIEQVSSRKSNSTSFEAGAHKGELRKWCVPTGTKVVCPRWCESGVSPLVRDTRRAGVSPRLGSPARQVCPHGVRQR